MVKYTDDFEKFWKKFKGRFNPDRGPYGTYVKVGKFEAFQEWKKLPKDEQKKAIAVAEKAGGQYTPDPCRWLKRKMFDDYN